MKLCTPKIYLTFALGLCLTLSMIPTNCMATLDDCLQDASTYELFQECRAFELAAEQAGVQETAEEKAQCIAECEGLSSVCTPPKYNRGPKRPCVSMKQRCISAC